MNKKKAFIPIVAIGALILSLLVVFPAFGAGTASFINPANIMIDDDGVVTDDETKRAAQTFGRQGGNIGLFVEDSGLDVPVRRVLIPELDGVMDDNNTPNDTSDDFPVNYGPSEVMAHSKVIGVDHESGLKVGDYLMVGAETVRKVAKVVTPTAVPTSTTSAWYMEVGTAERQVNPDTATSTSITIPPIPISFTSLPNGADVEVSSQTASDPTGTGLPTGVSLVVGSNTTNVLSATHTETGSSASLTLNAGGALANNATTATYTVTISAVSDNATDGDTTDDVTVKHVLTIEVFDPKMDEVTLDRAFAKDGPTAAGENVYAVDVYDDNRALKSAFSSENWASDYKLYALAHELPSSGNNIGANQTYESPNDIANSNITSIGTTNDITDRLGSASGNRRIDSKDAFVIDSDDQSRADGVSSITSNYRVTWGASSVAGDYLVAWFHEPNETEVTVKSNVEAGTNMVLQETGANTGEFALKIKTGDEKSKVNLNPVDSNGDKTYVPELPVQESDRVRLSAPASASSATLVIETRGPSFTNLSPEHNDYGSDHRPRISAQVTDTGSLVKKGDIDILFFITDGNDVRLSVNPTPVVNPDSDGEVREVSSGWEVSGRISGSEDPVGDAKLYWWIRAKDRAGNYSYSDQQTSDDDGNDPCVFNHGGEKKSAQDLWDEWYKTSENNATETCDPYVFHVDDTDPDMVRAETGRHWDTSLITGKSSDKTEYRASKHKKDSILVVFNEGLDITTVDASDFEVSDRKPVEANAYNVKVRAASDDDVEGYAKYDGTNDGVTSGNNQLLGYVFLRLASDMEAGDQPKVELVSSVTDLAGNELDEDKIDEADDRIAPTLMVEIAGGKRPVSNDKVMLTITADENIQEPEVTALHVRSFTRTDNSGKKITEQVVGPDSVAGIVVDFVSSTEYTATITPSDNGLYTVHVVAMDSGGVPGQTGNKTLQKRTDNPDDMKPIDVSDDTEDILFEYDKIKPVLDIDPADGDAEDEWTTDDKSAYILISFASEDHEYHKFSSPNSVWTGDDLDKHGKVTIISATLKSPGQDAAMDISGLLNPNEDGNVYLYKSTEPLAIGDHKLEVRAEDEAGNRHAVVQKATITVKEREPFKLKLNPGWNLVSLPGDPEDSDINTVIPTERDDITQVISYDPTVPGMWPSAARGADGMFAGTLTNITASRAYWIQVVNSFEALEVSIPRQSVGQARVLPTIQLAKGWNLVPVLDVDGDFKLTDDSDGKDTTAPAFSDADASTKVTGGYFDGLETGTRAYTFDTITNRWKLVDEVTIGKGYWVYVTKAGVIVP